MSSLQLTEELLVLTIGSDPEGDNLSKIRHTSRLCLIFILSTFILTSFQNCASEFETLDDGVESLASTETPNIPVTCSLPDGSKLTPGNSVTGYPMMSALSPVTCGSQVQRTCLNTGLFNGSLPVYASCQQQCLHPDNNQAVNSGGQYTYFTRASAATQAECDAARVVSSCQQSTGLFAPAVAATRFTACMVQVPQCAYSVVTGTSTPTGNSVGSTVMGFATQSSTYPNLCGNQVTRSCQASGQWTGAVPVYTACTQQCLHPDNNQAVGSGSQYTYFTRSTGATQAECDAARVVSSCQQSTGLFAPAVAATRFTACMVQGQTCAYSVVAGTSTPTGNSVGSTVSGFATQSSTYPNLCGNQVTRSCQASGQWTGAVPVYTACTQQCRHPDNNQAVNSGSQYTYFTRSTGATQAECDAARVVSSCQQSTGLFAPAVATTRFTACTVQAASCAYSVVTGTSPPTGTSVGSTVTGFATQSATFPNVCGNQVTRTCQSTSQWSGTVPVYTACAQKCLHPDTSQPVDSGTQYTYYTRPLGTAAECTAARVVSSCQQTLGYFTPGISETRYSTCQEQVVPDRVTHEMLVGDDARFNVLKMNCTACHNSMSAQGGLNLMSPTESKSKAAVILSRMKSTQNPMPPTGTIKDTYKIALVEKWVSLGAPSDATPPVGGVYAPDNGPVVSASNKIVSVSTAAQLLTAMAAANAGDVLQLNAGTYRLSDDKIRFNRSGTSNNPIFIRATQLGTATIELCNVEGFYVSGANWIFENLVVRGVCADGSKNEHAFHIVGGGSNTILRNNKVVNFMSHVKTNCDVSGSTFTCPSGIKFINNRWFNDKAMPGNAPFNVLNIDGSPNAVVRGNLFYDFASANSAKSATAIYPKMHSDNVLVEQNFVVCEKNLVTGSNRRGINVGDATDGNPNCKNSDCTSFNGTFRNNIVINCQGSGNSFGIGVINQDTSQYLNNTTINVKQNWFDETSPVATNLFKNNLFAQGWASQVSGRVPLLQQNYTLTRADGSDLFRSPRTGQFGLISTQVPMVLNTSTDTAAEYDFCGNKRGTLTTVGAIDYMHSNAADCVNKLNQYYMMMIQD